MATPTSNSVTITRLSFSGLTDFEAALIDGYKWGGGYGSGVTLTYSFPWASGQVPYYQHGYSWDNEWLSSSGLSSAERSAVVRALESIAKGADITFSEVADTPTLVGELRFTETTRTEYAHAYLPFRDSPASGDVWFSQRWWNPGGGGVAKGSYDYLTILHEIGHALGLKHSFESGGSGVALSPAYDHYQWTVMSYTAHRGAGDNVWAEFNPTTLMYLDLVALETLYGPSRNANPGNTKYVYREDRTYWETISDSSGKDTVIYKSSSRDGFIDLSNDEFSRMGQPVAFSDGEKTSDTIRFGPSTVIENATGGDGDDILIGNSARNTLKGNVGSDELSGAGKDDLLKGGAGADTLQGGSGSDTLIGGAGGDRLVGGGGDDLLYLEQADDDLVDSSGTDTVLSMVGSYALGASLEHLRLGDGALDGEGNDLDNAIEGNASANALRGAGGADSLSGGDGDDTLSGGSGNDTLDGGSGNDSLDGGAGIDRLATGKGRDTLVWDLDDVRVNGGSGTDTLQVFGDLDLIALGDSILLKIERIDLVDAVANVLTLGESDVLALSSTGALTVVGDGSDTMNIGGFTIGDTAADGFQIYTAGAATLLIDPDIAVVV